MVNHSENVTIKRNYWISMQNCRPQSRLKMLILGVVYLFIIQCVYLILLIQTIRGCCPLKMTALVKIRHERRIPVLMSCHSCTNSFLHDVCVSVCLCVFIAVCVSVSSVLLASDCVTFPCDKCVVC